MLEQLKIIMGAVAKKDIVPVLTHIHVMEGALQASNGRIALHVPCSETMGVSGVNVPGRRLYQAVKAAGAAARKWQQREDGRLRMKAGKMQVTLPLSTEAFPVQQAPDAAANIDGATLLSALERARGFVATDGTKPWACGTLLDPDGYVYSTNNVALVRTPWAPLVDAPPVVVPVDTVDELLRLSRVLGPPCWADVEDDRALTLGWPCGTWLRATLLVNDWPTQRASMILDATTAGDPVTDLLPEVRSAVEAVVPFSADEKAPTVIFGPDGIRTRESDTEAVVELAGLPEGQYRSEVLAPVLAAADRVWFGSWPDPVRFAGPETEGIFVGLRA